MADTLYLVDGSSYLYRAFHALPALSNSGGEPTGALYGVANMVRRLIREQNPTHLAVVFDAPGKTFRHDAFPDYKATRPPMPDELRSQVDPLKALLRAMGVPLLIVPEVEADDVIATLARQAEREGMQVVISSSDKDLAQLVTDRITLVNTMTDTTLDVVGVEDKFGVPPHRIIDYLTLIGDKVDNVPGVDKVGPKTAAKWLAEYGSLDEIMARADEFGGKIGGYLREALGHLPKSRELVTVKDDVALELGPGDLKMGQGNALELRQLFEHFEFTSWLAELDQKQEEAGESEAVALEVSQICTMTQLTSLVDELAQARLIALDTETDSRDPCRARLVGISVASQAGRAAYIPLTHDYPGCPSQLDTTQVLDALRPLLTDPDKQLVGQNFKYDLIVLQRHGLEVSNLAYDTMLESYCFNASGSRHDMDTLAEKHLARRTIHFEDVAGKGAKQIPFNQVELDPAAEYAGEDAEVTLALHHALWPRLEALEGPRRVFCEIEMPLVPVLARIERQGVLVDAAHLKRLSGEFSERMQAIETRAHEVAGQPFNMGSPKQLGEILFEKLQLPVIKKTPKGAPSTAEDVLSELAKQYELPSLIMEHRQLSKLKSTYTDKLPAEINAETGRIHTTYQQAVAATGRLSSANPNLQNIPIRTEEGRRIRRAFIAEPGFSVLAADYSQIELRIMAHLSDDDGLQRAFREGRDIHAATAEEVFGSPERRSEAKAINFGLIYGMSAFGLASRLGIERGEAQDYIDLYFSRYPGVADYMERTREKAKADGYVETLFGRRLYLPEIRSRNYQRRQGAERAAINAPMQGTAADIIKRAMIDLDDWIQAECAEDLRMMMQVHDELVFECRSERVQELTPLICERMSRAAELSVPLVVEAGHGENWDEAH